MDTFTMYKRKLSRGTFFYVRFREADDTWSSGRNSGQTSQASATAWALEQIKQNQIPKTRLTLAEYTKDFFQLGGLYHREMTLFQKRSVKPQTLSDHQNRLRLHILPTLGNKPLTNITPNDIKDLQAKLLKPSIGLSTQSVVHVVNTLSVILRMAESELLIPPFPRIKRVSIRSQERGTFTVDEARTFLAADWGDIRHKVINLLAATTGMRQAEILGLTWGAVHNDYIEVFSTWDEVEKKLNGDRNNPATKAGRIRAVPLVQEVAIELEKLKNGSPWCQDNDFVFAETKKRPLANHKVLRVFRIVLEQSLGIGFTERRTRILTFHSWRHFYNSSLINGRIPLLKVQGLVGHSSEKMSARYFHSDEMADVREVLNKVLSPIKILSK